MHLPFHASRITHHASCLPLLFAFLCSLPLHVHAVSPTFTTLAGSAATGSTNGAGPAAQFSNPQAVATDPGGNIYVADTGNNIIRLISPAGTSSTIAGSPGQAGSTDGSGASARFNQPSGITLDSLTNIYVADYGNHTIRQITPLGVVTTIAGVPGLAGNSNGVGVAALFFHPMGMAADSGNNLYVADYGNHLIRKITPARTVSTLAGSAGNAGYTNGVGTAAAFYNPQAVAVDQAGTVYVADTGNAAIRAITLGGSVTLLAGSPGSLGSQDGTGSAALFFQPAGIAINSTTNLLVSDSFNHTIRIITPGGVVTTIAGLPGSAGSADGLGTVARFLGPQGLAVNLAGLIYVADSGNNAIRAMTTAGVVSTFGGSPSGGSVDGPTTISRFYSPQSIAADSSGNLYIADAQNSTIRRITQSGNVSLLAGSPGVFGSADATGTNALFAAPQGLAVDSSGNVFVSDTGNHTIRKVSSVGVVTTVAGAAGLPGNADGTGTNAHFFGPTGIGLDNANNIYVADTWNHTIRKITPAGVVTTVAGSAGYFGSADGPTNSARLNCPLGVAVRQDGSIYVADYGNNSIRELNFSQGLLRTVAGSSGIWGSADGTNNTALFFGPAGISVDTSSNLYVTDSGNNTLRKITPAGTNWAVATIAGTPSVTGSSDGIGSAALFYNPSGIAVNSAGYLFVTDPGNNDIRTSEGVPLLTWANSAPITYGTPLSGTQLNATANVPGTFAYNPLSGTILNAGTNLLSVYFTPTDSANYRGAGASVSLAVLRASLTVTANNARRATGLPNPPFGGNITGLQNNDNITASYNSTATAASPPGQYPITPSLIDPANRQTNYTVNFVNGTLTVIVPPAFQSEARSGTTFTFTWTAVSNQTYQVQYSTNLLQDIWLNLGAPITATNTIATASDSLSFPLRFYRLTLSP